MNDFAVGILGELREADRRCVTEWASDGNVILPHSKRSSEFREDTAYWINEPLNAIADCEAVSLCKPTQGSGTTMEEVFLTHLVATHPRDTHFMAQTDPDAEAIFKKKILRTLRASPSTAPILAAAGRDDITKNKMTLPTMDFAVHGPGLNSMQSDSVEVLLLDEAWRYPPGTIGEIKERTSTVEATRKIVAVSQAGEEVVDEFGREGWDEWGNWWHQGTQEVYEVRCPCCGVYFEPKTEHYHCSEKARNPETKEWRWKWVRWSTFMLTPCCEHRIANTPQNRRSLSASGKYRQTNFNHAPRHRSFRYSAWVVYWQDWAGLLEQFLRAQDALKRGDIAPLKIWTQKKEAHWWTIKHREIPIVNNRPPSGYVMATYARQADGSIPKWEHEEERFMKVDVQKYGFYCSIHIFGNDRSRMVYCGTPTTEDDLKALVLDYGIPNNLVALDCGHDRKRVFELCHRNKWTALRGRSADNFTRVKGRQKLTKPFQIVPEQFIGKSTGRKWVKILVNEWSNTYFKDILARLNADPERHEWPDDVSQDFVDSMFSEEKHPHTGIWKPVGSRKNHFWDTCAMGVYMAFRRNCLGDPEPEGDDDGEDSSEQRPIDTTAS